MQGGERGLDSGVEVLDADLTTVDALTLTTGAVTWPATAATPVSVSARWLGASVEAQGELSPTQADLALNWRDLALREVAPYVAQVLTQPLSGRSAGALKLRWQAPAPQTPGAAAPALQLQLLDLSLQDLALGSAARPHNSPLMKLPTLPAANPVGTQGAMKSVISSQGRWRVQAAKAMAEITPSIPP